MFVVACIINIDQEAQSHESVRQSPYSRLNTRLRRWRPSSRIPCTPLWDCPIAITIPHPIHLLDDLLLRCNECINGAHTIALLWAALDACEWGHPIVDDDPYLLAWDGRALEDCVAVSKNTGISQYSDVRWNWTLVEKGASCETLKDWFSGMWSYGNGP